MSVNVRKEAWFLICNSISQLRYNNEDGNEFDMLVRVTEFTSKERVMFVIKFIDGDKIERFDYNIKLNVKFTSELYYRPLSVCNILHKKYKKNLSKK